jgi:Flp pilus assembly protein TadB
MPSDHPPEGEPFSPIGYTSDVFPTERADTGHAPRKQRKGQRGHRSRRAHTTHSRPWYHPRPQRGRRADLMGFNVVMWVLAVVLIVVLILWF